MKRIHSPYWAQFSIFLLFLLLATGTLCAEQAAEKAMQPLDHKAYNNIMRNVDQGYQDALTKNGTDAAYNAKIERIDAEYNRSLGELGYGPSITMKGHFGKGTQTDKALFNVAQEEENAPAAVAETKPKRGPIGIAQ